MGAERGGQKVNEPQTEAEVKAIQQAVRRGQPYGSTEWVEQTARRLGLEATLRAPHRPRNPKKQ
jgi:hypothetical protein